MIELTRENVSMMKDVFEKETLDKDISIEKHRIISDVIGKESSIASALFYVFIDGFQAGIKYQEDKKNEG